MGYDPTGPIRMSSLEDSSEFMQFLPDDARLLKEKELYVRKIYHQFGLMVNKYICEHVNSLYLKKDVGPDGISTVNHERLCSYKSLVVYVDDSLVAAELNAQRELIKLKYREHFGIIITSFDIRLSKGNFLNRHPLISKPTTSDVSRETSPLLPESVQDEIDHAVSVLESADLRESFRRAMESSARMELRHAEEKSTLRSDSVTS